MSGVTDRGHVAVLAAAVLQYLAPRHGEAYVDCTAGAGGLTRLLLDASSPDGRVLAIDADGDAVRLVQSALSAYGSRLSTVHANFRSLAGAAAKARMSGVDGIVFDLGFSSIQLERSGRGLSFRRDEPLDMRFDTTEETPTAQELLLSLPEKALADVLWTFGEEPASRRIARAIVARRKVRPIRTTGDLRQIVHSVISGGHGLRIDSATRTFQALRIAVNRELEALELALPQAIALLKPGGRLAVIAFHSLEDRAVKQFFSMEARDCICPPEVLDCRCMHRATLSVLTPKPVVAAAEELAQNPRARSAKLRVAMKLPNDSDV